MKAEIVCLFQERKRKKKKMKKLLKEKHINKDKI